MTVVRQFNRLKWAIPQSSNRLIYQDYRGFYVIHSLVLDYFMLPLTKDLEVLVLDKPFNQIFTNNVKSSTNLTLTQKDSILVDNIESLVINHYYDAVFRYKNFSYKNSVEFKQLYPKIYERFICW